MSVCFGPITAFSWDPDSAPNPHMLSWGGSGAGKTRLLREIVAHLAQHRKHPHIIDVHGELGVIGESTLDFGGIRRSNRWARRRGSCCANS